MNARKILIVDDNALVVKAFSNVLRGSEYQVFTAQDGASAVRVARQQRPDLILLDLCFPPDVAHGGGVPWDGFLIMGWLSRINERTPVIIITGSDSLKSRERAFAAGAADYLLKPVEPGTLLAAVQDVIGGPFDEEVPAGRFVTIPEEESRFESSPVLRMKTTA